MTALLLADGSQTRPKAMFTRVPFRQHTDIATQLGCLLTKNSLIEATKFGETKMPGVFAACDATTLFRQVAIAGAWINRELITEDVRRKIEPNILAM